MVRKFIVLVAVVLLSAAYLVYALRRLGVWGGILFAAIWIGVFSYARLKSKSV